MGGIKNIGEKGTEPGPVKKKPRSRPTWTRGNGENWNQRGGSHYLLGLTGEKRKGNKKVEFGVSGRVLRFGAERRGGDKIDGDGEDKEHQ